VSLRTRLALVFIAATLVPLGATVWVTTILLDYSLRQSPVDQLSRLSRSLEKTGQKYYQQACEQLKADALAGRIPPAPLASPPPDAVADFAASSDNERFTLTGDGGSKLLYLVRTPTGIQAFERTLDIRMTDLSREYSDARSTVETHAFGNLRRGVFIAWGLAAGAIWLVALTLVWLAATRFSRPIVKLTEALQSLAAGDFRIRVPNERADEIGLATEAFNRMATQLEQSRDRLVYLTQLASWQVLARKTAHEVKNSLTPIRLTVEEMVARSSAPDRLFLEQAAGIVVDEIESLARRIHAFSEFSSEPPVCLENLDVHELVEERIAFLKAAHPEVRYAVEVAENTPSALADEDLVKGILVNLLENAAEAAGDGGQILTRVRTIEDRVAIEVHDSGPGLSDLARTSLFQPTISFKKRGMGLGLSIARKSALLSGGDILLIAGELGGAGFRVLLPVVTSVGTRDGIPAHSGR
jgi:nitrogen fixation/metabolism regulation signal transduction histidine kinase